MGAEAAVHAEAEAGVRIVPSVEVHRVGVGVAVFVPVGGGEITEHPGARGERPPVEDRLLGGHPRHERRRRTGDQVQSVAGLRDDLLRRISAVLRSGLAQAEATGEIGQGLDPDELLARLLGPVIFRVSIQQVAVDRDFTDRLVEGALGIAER
jgi:Tetracyclin repressor-like, C-terminal domain